MSGLRQRLAAQRVDGYIFRGFPRSIERTSNLRIS